MISKYLLDLGLEEDDIPQNLCPDDSRQENWKNARKEFGFDERETWNLNYSIVLYIYTRLKMYDEINIVNTGFHKFEHKNRDITFQEGIDIVLKCCETYLTIDDTWSEEFYKSSEELFEVLGKIFPALWW